MGVDGNALVFFGFMDPKFLNEKDLAWLEDKEDDEETYYELLCKKLGIILPEYDDYRKANGDLDYDKYCEASRKVRGGLILPPWSINSFGGYFGTKEYVGLNKVGGREYAKGAHWCSYPREAWEVSDKDIEDLKEFCKLMDIAYQEPQWWICVYHN